MCQRAICCQGLFGCFILDQTSEGVELLLIEVNPKQIMAPATYFYLMLVPSRSASAQMGQFHFSGFILSFELFLSSASISVSDFHGIWMTSSISEIGQYLVGVNAGCSMPVIAPSAFCLPRRASKAGEKRFRNTIVRLFCLFNFCQPWKLLNCFNSDEFCFCLSATFQPSHTCQIWHSQLQQELGLCPQWYQNITEEIENTKSSRINTK